MKFDWAYEVIFVYLISNIVKKIWSGSDLEICLCDDFIKHNYQ